MSIQPIEELVATDVAGPWGPVLVAATDRGVVAVAVLSAPEAFAGDLERRLGQVPAWSNVERSVTLQGESHAIGHLRAATVALRREFSGDGTALHGLILDLEDRPAWDRVVLDAVRAIPRGETRRYGEVARAIGRPGAARAVGGAVGRNPVALIIPCHRVVAGDGTLGGYGGGWWGERDRLLDLKAELLAREGVKLPRSRSRA